MDKKLEPKIRFTGFNDAWEQRKLGSISNRVTIKNTNLDTNLPLTISAEYGLVDQVTYFNKQVASENLKGYILAHQGDFAYNKSYSKNYPMGAVKRLEKYDKGAVSTLYIVFKPIGVSSDFLAWYYESSRWYPEIIKRASEGARNHGLLNISPSDFFDSELIIPSNINEQIKIGSSLEKLNNLITANQRKEKLLQDLKKFLMQNVFPKSGQKNPDFRFRGFTDDWEQRKLGESFSERKDRNGSKTMLSVTINDGVIPFDSLDRRDNSSKDKSNYKTVEVGDIPYNSMRMWQGASGTSNYKGIVSPAYTVLMPENDVCSQFFSFLFKSRQVLNIFQRFSQGLTSDTWNLKYPQLSQIVLSNPSTLEQQKIADALLKLDNLITANQQKTAQLKSIKKFLMQNMFI